MSGKNRDQTSNLKSSNLESSKSNPMEIEIYHSNNRPNSKQKIFQLKEELKQKKNEILGSKKNSGKFASSKDTDNNFIENINAAVDKIKILKDGYEASRDKAAEVMKSEELSVYLQVHGQRTNKLYSALSTLIYASIGISKADELEDYIKKAASHVPTNLFNLKEWENVISVAKEFRVVDSETAKREIEIMKNNTKLFHFLAKNPLKNTKEEILLLKNDVTNQLNAMQTDLINGKNLINFLAQKMNEIVNMSGVEKIISENKELKTYYAKEYEKMQKFIDALVAKQKEETNRAQNNHDDEMFRLNEIISKYERDLVDFEFSKSKFSTVSDKNRELQTQLYNLEDTLKNEKQLYKDTINNISISNFSDTLSRNSIEVAMRNALINTLQSSFNTKNDEINDKILQLTSLEEKYNFDNNELKNKIKKDATSFERTVNDHVTSIKLLTATKEQLEMTLKETKQKIKQQEDAIENLQDNLNILKETSQKQAEIDIYNIKQLEEKISELEQKTIPQMMAKIETQKIQLEEKQLAIEQLEKDKANTKEINENLHNTINNISDKENDNSIMEDHKNNLAKLEIQLNEKDNIISNLKIAIEENKINLSQSEIVMKEKEETIVDLRSQLEEKAVEANVLHSSSIADLPPDVAEVQKTLNDTLKRMKESETKYNKDVKYWKSQAETVQNQIKDLNVKLKNSEDKIQSLTAAPPIANATPEEIKSLKDQNQDLKIKLSEVEAKLKVSVTTPSDKENENLRLLVHNQNKEIEKLKKSAEIMEAQLSEGDNQSNAMMSQDNSTFSFCESVARSPRIAGASPRTAPQYQAQAMVLDIIKKGINSVKKSGKYTVGSINSVNRVKKTAASLDRVKASIMIQSIIRGFLGRLRVKRVIAIGQGVLIAHSTTKQGETGWYFSQGLLFYFCMDKGEFVLLCGPITQDMYDLAMEELDGLLENEKGKFPLEIILDRGAIHATRIQIEVLLEDIRERDVAIEQYKLDLMDYKNAVDQSVLMQYNKYQSQVDELAAKLIEYENSIVSLDKEREVLTRKLQMKQKTSDTNYDLILNEVNALNARNKKFFIKLTSLARGFIARLRVKKLILFKKSKETGVLIAMKNTKQGESGWYISPDSSIYYFVLKNGEWIHAIGPISEKEFEHNRLMVKQRQRQNNPAVITKVPYTIIDYHDEVFEIGEICMSNKYEKLFVALPLDVLIPSGASRAVSVMDQIEDNSLSQLSSVSGLDNIAENSGSAKNNTINNINTSEKSDKIKVTLQN